MFTFEAGLAVPVRRRYVRRMRLPFAGRLISLFAALVLAAGIAAHGSQAMQMDGKMETTAAASHPAPDMCQGCGGDDSGMAVGACFAVCTVTIALPADSLAAPEPIAERIAATADASGIGHFGPPDPYPPRRIVLS